MSEQFYITAGVTVAAVIAALAIYRLGYRAGLQVADHRRNIEAGLPVAPVVEREPARAEPVTDDEIAARTEVRSVPAPREDAK